MTLSVIAGVLTLSTAFASKVTSSLEEIATPTTVIGLSSGYHVSYIIADGVTPTEAKERLRNELKKLYANRCWELWSISPDLPPLEHGIRVIDVYAFIYADLANCRFSMSYWHDMKKRNAKIAELLNLPKPGKPLPKRLP